MSTPRRVTGGMITCRPMRCGICHSVILTITTTGDGALHGTGTLGMILTGAGLGVGAQAGHPGGVPVGARAGLGAGVPDGVMAGAVLAVPAIPAGGAVAALTVPETSPRRVCVPGLAPATVIRGRPCAPELQMGIIVPVIIPAYAPATTQVSAPAITEAHIVPETIPARVVRPTITAITVPLTIITITTVPPTPMAAEPLPIIAEVAVAADSAEVAVQAAEVARQAVAGGINRKKLMILN